MAEYDRASELKAFDETKAGVKAGQTKFSIPVIDLGGLLDDSIRRNEIVEKVREASETWGFFQIVNHGIPVGVLEEMKDGVKRFHEQDTEVKKQFYTRDVSKPVVYDSNFDLYSAPSANWRDTLTVHMAPNPPKPEDLPEVSRHILMEYSKEVMKVGDLLLELLSEALGLNPSHLKDIDCAQGVVVLGHYYPACPQPELTLGTSKHSDNNFLTVLLQDHIGGLQVLLRTTGLTYPMRLVL
ncbi:hypothetical protein FNV43_RR01159 [Rhamnella rubrinervis]|uniref:Uncharacterized protein n=1 Tax=Rhamnella rubrinervis TaxID=2594499 RepID=A0A8K0HPB3_9ROSA|nr:hypothetical protein FNV43_RR01159 [Rhamnella rubrinervis]